MPKKPKPNPKCLSKVRRDISIDALSILVSFLRLGILQRFDHPQSAQFPNKVLHTALLPIATSPTPANTDDLPHL
jgi:hypothetical protein